MPSSSSSSMSRQSPGQSSTGQSSESTEKAKEGLWYSNVLCGVVRGALEMVSSEIFSEVMQLAVWTNFHSSLQVQYQVTAQFVSDVLRGDERTEMKVTLLRIMDEEVPAGDD